MMSLSTCLSGTSKEEVCVVCVGACGVWGEIHWFILKGYKIICYYVCGGFPLLVAIVTLYTQHVCLSSTLSSSPAQINLGRIAALLGYCYNLCKTYISQNMAAGSLVSFIAMVATWLFKFLIKAKFYDWLEKQGGWVRTVHSRD